MAVFGQYHRRLRVWLRRTVEGRPHRQCGTGRNRMPHDPQDLLARERLGQDSGAAKIQDLGPQTRFDRRRGDDERGRGMHPIKAARMSFQLPSGKISSQMTTETALSKPID